MTGGDRKNGRSSCAATHLRFAAELGVDISGEKLDCKDMQPFNSAGSANPAIYWAPEQVSLLLTAVPLWAQPGPPGGGCPLRGGSTRKTKMPTSLVKKETRSHRCKDSRDVASAV